MGAAVPQELQGCRHWIGLGHQVRQRKHRAVEGCRVPEVAAIDRSPWADVQVWLRVAVVAGGGSVGRSARLECILGEECLIEVLRPQDQWGWRSVDDFSRE